MTPCELSMEQFDSCSHPVSDDLPAGHRTEDVARAEVRNVQSLHALASP